MKSFLHLDTLIYEDKDMALLRSICNEKSHKQLSKAGLDLLQVSSRSSESVLKTFTLFVFENERHKNGR